MDRLKNINMKTARYILIAITVIFVSAVILGTIYTLKTEREKEKQSIINDSITKVEVQKTHKWIVDTIYTENGYFYTVAHNFLIPKLGVKIEDSIKPKYSIHDTIKF